MTYEFLVFLSRVADTIALGKRKELRSVPLTQFQPNTKTVHSHENSFWKRHAVLAMKQVKVNAVLVLNYAPRYKVA
jgi:hypothetical protein